MPKSLCHLLRCKSCPSREYLASQMCHLTLFANISGLTVYAAIADTFGIMGFFTGGGGVYV